MELVQRLVLRKGVKNMKKQYVKPELYFENFELSTSIAACEYKTKLPSKGSCGFDDGNAIIFVSNLTGCDTTDDGSGKICYDNPLDSNNLFSS